MTQADRVHSTPRTCSSRSTENPPTATAAADPVVSLSGQLLTIWDALDASEAESLKLEREKDINLKAKRDRTTRLLEEWRVSVETQIGFTQATSAAGALVQLARVARRAGHARRSTRSREAGRDRAIRIRLIRSAMRAIKQAPGTDLEPVRSILEIYPGPDTWFEDVQRWAQQGRHDRQASSD